MILHPLGETVLNLHVTRRCKLHTKTVFVQSVTDRDSGSMTFNDMDPGVYTLKVMASDSRTKETARVERFFEISDHPDFCGLHLINDGLTVTGSSIHVQFAGVPSTIKTFRCKLDNKPGFDCENPSCFHKACHMHACLCDRTSHYACR